MVNYDAIIMEGQDVCRLSADDTVSMEDEYMLCWCCGIPDPPACHERWILVDIMKGDIKR
jgi:hypothetical protein